MKNSEFRKLTKEERQYGLMKSLVENGVNSSLANLVLKLVDIDYQYSVKRTDINPNLDGYKSVDISNKITIAEEVGKIKTAMARRVIYIKEVA